MYENNSIRIFPKVNIEKVGSMKTVESVSLSYQDEKSDKVYHLQLNEESADAVTTAPPTYRVDFQFGRRGSTLNTGTKVQGMTLELAKKAYDKIKDEKVKKGYQIDRTRGVTAGE
jgi:predicted DNA-binding WGR domain protein